ncbi:hypothetical protein J1614_003962 [Plenodomus biglobosus]|nr:hypothetical protein J1614_003962 [Plenodomus biglobosus]
MFSMADMRLFHHFLVTAYPHLPVGADKIWVSVIPSFAHNYKYLIHSILALAASHLDAVSNSSVAEQAIQHRIIAVKSLNEALSAPPKTQCERDARMAAALALAFQSSHLQDGMAEFLLMIRGCNIIASDEAWDEQTSAFNPFHEDAHLLTLQTPLGPTRLQQIPPASLTAATTSLTALHSLPMAPHEQAFHRTLLQTIKNAHSNPVKTYTSFTSLYILPSTWAPPTFSSFISPANATAQILLAHFIAVQTVLAPLLYSARPGFAGVEAPTKMLAWVESVYCGVGGELRRFVEWPRGVAGVSEER